MDYVKILKRAAEITWRHKALWLFGFLLAFFSGGGGGNFGRMFQYRMRPGDSLPPWLTLGLILFLAGLAFVFVLAGIVLSSISQCALIGMVCEVQQTERTSIRSGWHIGWSRFLPLIGIDLLTGIPVLILVVVLISLGLSPLVLLFFQKRALTILGVVLTVLFMLLVIGLLIIMGAVLGLWRDFAYRQCVVEKKGVLDSLRGAYQVVRQNLKHVGIIWLLLFGTDLLVGFIMLPLALIAVGMAAAPAGMLYALTDSVALAIFFGLVIAVPAILLLTFVAGIYQAFRSAVWTLTYLAL